MGLISKYVNYRINNTGLVLQCPLHCNSLQLRAACYQQSHPQYCSSLDLNMEITDPSEKKKNKKPSVFPPVSSAPQFNDKSAGEGENGNVALGEVGQALSLTTGCLASLAACKTVH